MGSASSTELQEARSALELLARVVRPQDEGLAKFLEALSISSDPLADTTSLNVRKQLTARAGTKAPSGRKRKATDPREEALSGPREEALSDPRETLSDPREKVLSDHFRKSGVSASKIPLLVSSALYWESRRETLLEFVGKEAPCWKENHSLFWGKFGHSAVPLTAVTKARYLVHEVEHLDALSGARRRLYLMIIDELIVDQTRLLSEAVNQLHQLNNINQEHLSLESRESLAGERTKLITQIRGYPHGGDTRSRVVRKLARDLWGNDQKKKDKFAYAISYYVNKQNRYEEQDWNDIDYRAMISYWIEHSGIYLDCTSHSPLVAALKQGFWECFPNPTAEEANASRFLDTSGHTEAPGILLHAAVISPRPTDIGFDRDDTNSALQTLTAQTRLEAQCPISPDDHTRGPAENEVSTEASLTRVSNIQHTPRSYETLSTMPDTAIQTFSDHWIDSETTQGLRDIRELFDMAGQSSTPPPFEVNDLRTPQQFTDPPEFNVDAARYSHVGTLAPSVVFNDPRTSRGLRNLPELEIYEAGYIVADTPAFSLGSNNSRTSQGLRALPELQALPELTIDATNSSSMGTSALLFQENGPRHNLSGTGFCDAMHSTERLFLTSHQLSP
ncbi:hypothetical protein FGG08_000629 [Glutinoglossum americanum]|uniref:Uncharacterized protein n=1 Tax=Glutinoglossum americanum TaxID=1670608 RepID=A0A9P8ICX5_9PEZI|nr:hypothetical protein FGG08_000629 [Glutinoglossum americanum]